ncbi:MAG: hypothetical protein ABI147_14035 [Acidobacteriaceae bacterium]
MNNMLRKLLSLTLAMLLVSAPLARAQQSASAPVPPQIVSAHNVFVANGGGPNLFTAFTGGADRGYSQLYADMQQWDRYRIVSSPAEADLIFEIHSIAPAVDVGGTEGTALVYNPQLILRILDPKTNAILWTTTSNVVASGRQASRDEGFDQSVVALVYRVRQLVGGPLDATQLKAIHSNSHPKLTTSFKVLLGVGVAAVAGLAIFGAYKVSHHSTPTLPPCPNPPFCPA